MFAVNVQAIRPVSSNMFRMRDVGHICRYLHKAKIVDSDERRPKNYDFEGEDVYATAFMASVESVDSTNKIVVHGLSTRVHQVI